MAVAMKQAAVSSQMVDINHDNLVSSHPIASNQESLSGTGMGIVSSQMSGQLAEVSLSDSRDRRSRVPSPPSPRLVSPSRLEDEKFINEGDDEKGGGVEGESNPEEDSSEATTSSFEDISNDPDILRND